MKPSNVTAKFSISLVCSMVNADLAYYVGRLDKAGFHTYIMARPTFHHHSFATHIIHICIIANGSLKCFSWGLFLGPV